MSALRVRTWLATAAALALALPLGPPAGGAEQVAGPGVTVELDQDTYEAGPGEKLSFVSTVTNTGERSRGDLIAHLNILTTDEDVYVDPEDWSPTRTQYLEELAPGDSAQLTWDVQAVTSGPLILFVSVTSTTDDQVVSSGPLRLTVGGQRVVESGQVLPLVLFMPAGVLTLLGATLVRRRRHR
jgi:hypothetical protein